MREVNKIASSLFDKIRSRVDTVSLGDENAKDTQDPEQARFFNFVFKQDGVDIGNVTISLIDEESLKVYFGADITSNIKEHGFTTEQWFAFLRSLRMFAKRNLLSFDTRDIAKSNLQIKDVKQQSKSDSTVDSGDLQVTESRMYGSTRHSFVECGTGTRLRIAHDGHIDPEINGSRTRRIKSIFVETSKGERFLLPFKNLHGARAMGQLIDQGGSLHDERGQHICELVTEMSALSHFVRSTKHRQFEDQETDEMTQAAVHRYDQIKRTLRQMRGARGTRSYFENWLPEDSGNDDMDYSSVRERYVKKLYDERFDQALPYVIKAHRKHMEAMHNPMAEEFEDWADSMVEGTWAVPEQESEVDNLRQLMSTPLLVGLDGQDATSALYHIIGDDQLFDSIQELADIKGPDYDCRPEVVKWLMQHFPAIGQEMDAIVKQSEQPEQPVLGAEPVLGTPQPAEQQAAAPVPAQPVPQPAAESADPLDFIRQLAGLRK